MRSKLGDLSVRFGVLFIYGSMRLSVMCLKQIFGGFDRFIEREDFIRRDRSISLYVLCSILHKNVRIRTFYF